MDAVLRDLRYAVRMLLRTPGVTAAAVLALALGIGATTGIFSVVHAVLLRSLGWREESRLVAVRGNFEAQNLIGIWVSVPEYVASARMTLMVRAAGGRPGAPQQSVQAALAEIDRGQPPDWMAPFEDRIAGALAPRRFPLQLLGVFAALALVLSALGIYGVTAYGVTQRTREFGVRIAIGAQRGDVLRMVMAGAVKLAALGVALGVGGALIGARLLDSQLYGVGARDPLTYALNARARHSAG